MKNNYLKKPFIIFTLSFIICTNISLYASDYIVQIYTPRGNLVKDPNLSEDVWHCDEFPDDSVKLEGQWWENLIAYYNHFSEEFSEDSYVIDDASRTYNCHSYVWHVSEGGDKVWIGGTYETIEDIYWTDGSYDEMPSASSYTKISYSGNHSAIFASQGRYISKWGSLALMNHECVDCPSGYGAPSKYYRRSVDVPEDYTTIPEAINAAITGQTILV